MSNDARLRNLIRDVASEIVQDPEIRRLVREVVMSTVVKLRNLETAGVVRSFISACGARGIRIRLADDDRLMFTNGARLTVELRSVLFVYRTALVGHFSQIRNLERRRQTEYEARRNGKKK